MTLQEAQQQVDAWIKTYGVRYFSELTNLAVLTEEVGELARVMARRYGDQSFKAGEHDNLADEMADLVGPLQGACPDLRVLATSRRPLDLAAEHVHRLEALNAASSAELFRARALAARPGQVIDDDDLDELLARLEGIPLAIELAAARTRSLSVGQIAERLPGRPDLLTALRVR